MYCAVLLAVFAFIVQPFCSLYEYILNILSFLFLKKAEKNLRMYLIFLFATVSKMLNCKFKFNSIRVRLRWKKSLIMVSKVGTKKFLCVLLSTLIFIAVYTSTYL